MKKGDGGMVKLFSKKIRKQGNYPNHEGEDQRMGQLLLHNADVVMM